jgi:poly(3-hydroxybutyrate) depolymerase
MVYFRYFLLILLLALLPFRPASPQAGDGREQWVFDGWVGPSLRVFLTRPPGLAPDRPVVMVMHGMSRTAEEYRDQWHALALEHNFLLLVPEFTQADFPGSRAYNLGNMRAEDGTPVPRALWSFNVPSALFADARRRFGMRAERFALYGHSAGAQFVHRFLMHVPDASVARVVAANAGWYTMPDSHIDYPYGLRGSQVDEAALAGFLTMPVTILLGDADTLTDQDNLRQSPEANAQGPHRYARGHAFFETARQAAEDLQVPFHWQLVTVPGADHDNAKMAPAAVGHLLGD